MPAHSSRAVALLAALALGCTPHRRTTPAPDLGPVLGVWSGREGRSFNGYREWRLELRPENILQPNGKATPGTGQYVEGGVVCEVRFLANFYPGSVPRLNISIAGQSRNCDVQRFTFYAALPLADTMVGQLSEGSDDQYANVTFRRSVRPSSAP
ncbi:MAG TPA: hypothetical protein VKA84_05640 [Gemmatimonadaceae bacterium]|nr:hypothetical protein [Gemmatimonadaceae bacterium]